MKVDSFESVSKLTRQNFRNENKSEKNEIEGKDKKSQPEYRKDKKEYNEKKLEEDVKESVKDINDIIEKVKEDLSFEVHDETDRMMVKVIDRKTKEVIKELPPEEMLDLSARIHKIVGLLIDEKV